MAGGVTIKNVRRPKAHSLTAGGERLGLTDADYLLVEVSRFDNDQSDDRVVLKFDDYAGLEAEFEAGTATTVLSSALTTAVAAKTDWQDNTLTSTQRAGVVDVEFTES